MWLSVLLLWHSQCLKGGSSVNNKPYTSEALEQLEKLYDELERLPATKRSIVMLVAEAFINGMVTQERLTVQEAEQDSA